MAVDREPTFEERTVSSALGAFTERLTAMHRQRGSRTGDYSYETDVSGVEVALDLGYSDGTPGTPQCTLVNRVVSTDGQRFERLFSWGGPSPQTNWLNAGYTSAVALPDQGIPYFDHHLHSSRRDRYLSRVHPPVETDLRTEGPIASEDLREIDAMIIKIVEAQAVEDEESRVKNEKAARLERRNRLIHTLADAASREIGLVRIVERLSAEISSADTDLTTEIGSIDDDELQRIILQENGRLVSGFAAAGSDVLARVRSMLQEALEARSTVSESEL